MQKKTLVILGVAGTLVLTGGVVAAVAGPVVYRDLIAAPAAEAPTVQVTDSVATGAVDPSDLSGLWQVTEGSYAGYRVDEVLNGTDVTVTGRTENVRGELQVEGLELTAATLTVDVASITTDSGNRDAYFRDNALETDRYPEAVFTLTEPVTAEQVPEEGVPQSVTVRGELTLHGVTRAVEAEVQAVLAGDGGQVAGSIPVTFADFGVQAPNLGFVQVEPSGSIEFLLVIAPA